ncbi:P-loop containing nucleoside triphosphate hydrolase protein, partial [Blyttiomyces helicus]
RETNASISSQIFFNWVNQILVVGASKPLEESDLLDLAEPDSAAYIVARHRDRKKRLPRVSFLRDLLRGSWLYVMLQMVYSIVYTGLTMASPYFLNSLTKWVSDPNRETSAGWTLLAGLFLCLFLRGIIAGQLYYAGRRASLRIRAICVDEIYQKALRRCAGIKKKTEDGTSNEDNDASVGKIVTLMSTDVERLRESFSDAPRLVLETPLSLFLSLGGLFITVGWAAFSGVAVIILCLPFSAIVGKFMSDAQKALMDTTDKRVNATNEMLQGIRIIKYFGWESKFVQRITEARSAEIKNWRRLFKFLIYFICLTSGISLIVAFGTFAVYTLGLGHSLDSSVAFTTLALLGILMHSLVMLPMAVSVFFNFKVSLDRISKFLAEPELERSEDENSSSEDRPVVSGLTVGFRAGSFTHYSTDSAKAGPNEDGASKAEGTEAAPEFHLLDVDIEFPVGGLSLVTGATGSGKTSLILALLGEMKCVSGKHYLPTSHATAYVAQTAWIINATIRENILFGTPFDAERYQETIEACALMHDLETLEGGDLTEIGEKGVNLSGGQKARISLARAAYSHAPILLLDDPLSAVDAPTAKHLLHHCLLGAMKNRTIIVVSHAVGLVLPHADFTVVLKAGRVAAQGTPAEVIRNPAAEAIFGLELAASEKSELDATETAAAALQGTGTKLVDEEQKATGSVTWSVYWTFFAAAGGALFLTIFLFTFGIANIFSLIDNIWVQNWTDRAQGAAPEIVNGTIAAFTAVGPRSPIAFSLWGFVDSAAVAISGQASSGFFASVRPVLAAFTATAPVSVRAALTIQSENGTIEDEPASGIDRADMVLFLAVYGAISLSFTFATTAQLVFMIYSCIKAGTTMHYNLLKSVLGAPMRFFEVTPIGRILNRFTKDTASIDTAVMFTVQSFLTQVFKIVFILGLIAFKAPIFIVGAIPLIVIYCLVANVYLLTSRDLKRLESVSRSPLFSQFSETLSGVETVRAYGAQGRLTSEIYEKIDLNHRAYFLMWAANRWLCVRTDMMGALITLGAGLIVVSGSLTPGMTGLILVYALEFADRLLWTIRTHAEMEMSMNSVERVAEYTAIEQEPPAIIESARPPAGWPSKGAIEVKDLVVRYDPDKPAVLKQVSFTVRAGEKIGVVGRTGAGKSTLSLAFFRIIPLSGGSITIDGVDINTIGLLDLRSNLTIIPQDPTLFSGTLRSNLDPFGEHTDDELWAALESVHVLESLRAQRTTATSATSSTFSDSTVTDPAATADLLAAPTLARTPSAASGSSSSSSPLTLDAPVSDNGANFSQGQRQLLCMARALLRRSKVIVLDEATASVDHETDGKIQETIRNHFVDGTVLCIAHRLRTVVDYDRILVLDHGEVVEYGTPLELIESSSVGVFRRMVEETGESAELIEIARAKAAMI